MSAVGLHRQSNCSLGMQVRPQRLQRTCHCPRVASRWYDDASRMGHLHQGGVHRCHFRSYWHYLPLASTLRECD